MVKNMTVGIFEDVPAYGKRMAGYISGHEASPFMARLYLEHPASLPTPAPDVCMVSSALWPMYRDMMQGMQVLVLDESGMMPPEGGIRIALKYQSAALIYKLLLELCMESGKWRMPSPGGAAYSFEVQGIYTPVRDADAAQYVYRYLKDLGSRRKLLYLCLEPVYTGPDLASERETGTFSEVIYYLKQEKQSLGSRIAMMAHHDGFDLILPAAAANEMAELDAAEWQRLMTALREEAGYEQIVMDFGTGTVWPATAGCLHQLLMIRAPDTWEAMVADRFRASCGLLLQGANVTVDELVRHTEKREESS